MTGAISTSKSFGDAWPLHTAVTASRRDTVRSPLVTVNLYVEGRSLGMEMTVRGAECGATRAERGFPSNLCQLDRRPRRPGRGSGGLHLKSHPS